MYLALGQAFIAANSIQTDNETENLTQYTTMIETYLRKHKLFDVSNTPIKPATSKPSTAKIVAAKADDQAKSSLDAMKGNLNKDAVGEDEANLEDLMKE